MKLKITTARRKFIEKQGHDVDVLVRLRAPAPPEGHARPPLVLVPVVDVSGSMEGAKLDAVKAALLRLVDHLVPGDRIGLVTFSSVALLVAPIVELTEARRAELRRTIRKLRIGGGTNLAAGLITAARALEAARLPADTRCRAILLTDGQANEGVATTHDALSSLVREYARGLTISTFGYGHDCDHAVLAEMADAGGGSFAFIENEDVVITAFARELGGLLATFAADVRLEFVPAAGAPTEERLGDCLFHGELASFVRVAAAAHPRGENVELARIEVTWRDAAGREQRASAPVRVDFVAAGEEDTTDHADVARARDEKLVQLAQEAAERAARKGDYAAAHCALEEVAGKLTDPALVLFVREALAPCYENHEEYVGTPAFRGTSLQALKGRRVLVAEGSMPAALAAVPSEAEVAMEESFRERKGNKGKKSRTPSGD